MPLGFIDSVTDRRRAHKPAGADAILLTGSRSAAELDAVSTAVGVPLMIGPVPKSIYDVSYFANTRVLLAFQGHRSVYVAISA
jgi:carboxyvinyl-carboxyphosphonate phosphorylmutase